MRRNELDSGSQPVRNIAVNPGFETLSGNGVVQSNFITNPGTEATGAAVVVRTNYCDNPNLETNANGYAVNAGGGAATGAWQSSGGYLGSGFYRATWTAASTGNPYLEYSRATSPVMTPGKVYTFSGYIRPSVDLTMCASVGWANSSQGRISGQDGTPVLAIANTWTRISLTTTAAPVGTAGAWFDWKVTSGVVPIGGTLDVDCVLIEIDTLVGSYFDGATPAAARTNLIPSPSAANSNGWFGACGVPASTTTNNAGGPVGTPYARITITGTGTGTNYFAIAQGSTTNTMWAPALPGKTYTLSAYIRATMVNYQQPKLRMRWKNAAGVTISDEPIVSATGTTSGQWVRINSTGTAPAGTVYVELMGGFVSIDQSTLTVGDTVDVSAALLEEGSVLDTYFDGSTGAAGGFSYGWRGTANASPSFARDNDLSYAWQGTANTSYSEQRGVAVGGFSATSGGSNRFLVISSSQWVSSGTKSLRIIPAAANDGTINSTYAEVNVSGLTVGNTYYVRGVNRTTQALSSGYDASTYRRVVYPGTPPTSSAYLTTPTNTAGVFEFRGSFVASQTSHGIRFMNGAGNGGGDVWWDELMVTEIPPTSYFDGSTAASGDFTYNWTGTANASTSQQRIVGAAFVNAGNAQAGQSSDWSASGSKCLRIIPNTQYNTTSAILSGFTLEKGKTYTVLATRRLTAPLTGTLSSYAGTISSVQVGAPVGTVYSPVLPNVAGVAQARLTFTLDPATTVWTTRLGHGGAAGSGDVWWDNLMVVEGNYQGDYINPTQNVLAKWDGSANNSTSVGYAPQFLDIAGMPELDYTSTGTFTLDDSFGPTEARSFYTVFDNLTELTGALSAILQYGTNPLADTVPNTYLQLRMDTHASPGNNLFLRRTGAVGVGYLALPGFRYVVAWGINSSGQMFMGANGSTRATETQVMSVAHQKLLIQSNDSLHTHVRTLMFRGLHDSVTATAMSRYLGNKYGAAVL